jgi:hypothetical protein
MTPSKELAAQEVDLYHESAFERERRARVRAQTILRQVMRYLPMDSRRYIILSGSLDYPDQPRGKP